MLRARAARIGSGIPLAWLRRLRVNSSGQLSGCGPRMSEGNQRSRLRSWFSISSRTGPSRSLSTSIFKAISRAGSVAMPMCVFIRRWTCVRHDKTTSHETYSDWSCRRQPRSLLPPIRLQALLHQRPGPMPYVVFALEDTAPAQGAEQPLRPLVIRPELGEMAAGVGGALLEGREQSVRVALVPLLRQDHHVHQVGHPAAEPVAQAADPVADLVAQNEVVLVEGAGRAGVTFFLVEELGEPGREVLVLSHLSNGELAHVTTCLPV